MLRSAVFGAEEVVDARLRRDEGRRRVAIGYDILLQAEGGDEDAVEDVGGRADELDRGVDGNDEADGLALSLVLCVELGCGLQPHAVLRVVEVPEPLLAHHSNLHRVTDGDRHLRVVARSPEEDDAEDGRRDERPGDLESQVVGGHGAPRTAAARLVADGEPDHGAQYEHEGDYRHPQDEDEQLIDPSCKRVD